MSQLGLNQYPAGEEGERPQENDQNDAWYKTDVCQ